MGNVTEKTRKIIGHRINELLAINDVKQKELAAHLSVSDNIVSYFVKGARVPNTEQIIKIANFFNVSSDYLLGLSDAKTTDTDLKMIVDYTGLSEESASNLHNAAQTQFWHEKLSFINALILNDELLLVYCKYLESLAVCSALEERNTDVDLTQLINGDYALLADLNAHNPDNLDYGIYFDEITTTQPYILYEIEQQFLKFIKERARIRSKAIDFNQERIQNYITEKTVERMLKSDFFERQMFKQWQA